MPQIEVLDQQTIDKIAAGEVVERPASVVKELVENAIDAGSSAVTVEIKEGGISLIRITDNGCGIEKEQVPLAFLRHSTSKIRSVEDLLGISSLGFRGEALSSIAAVAQVELITKTTSGISGVRYVIEGGKEVTQEEIGAPEGSTFLVRNLFYNTPARRKFLKTPQTEAGYVSDLMERMALSHPEVSFKFIVNNQVKLHTSGNSNLKEIIYHIYGREIASNLLPIREECEGFSVEGYLGKPLISRGNRNFETYFINGRYVKSSLLAKGIEDGYQSSMMQHKYPFAVLHFSMVGEELDVNVHPTKMELRFSNQERVYEELCRAIQKTLHNSELVYETEIGKPDKKREGRQAERKREMAQGRLKEKIPEPFEKKRLEQLRAAVQKDSPYQMKFLHMTAKEPEPAYGPPQSTDILAQGSGNLPQGMGIPEQGSGNLPQGMNTSEQGSVENPIVTDAEQGNGNPQQNVDIFEQGGGNPQQDMNIPEQGGGEPQQRRLLDPGSVKYHQIIGQVFGTYWLVQMEDQLYIIDQHAAHEKVLYERTMASLKGRSHDSQSIFPPMLLSLTMQEEELLHRYLGTFTQLGFEMEHFGGREYSVTAVPANLFNIRGQDLMMELLDSLEQLRGNETPQLVLEKIASMSCKAAVKGNQSLSRSEMEALIDELLTLENPYHCPHGRPTIISMSRYELEKKFKRVL